MKFEENLMAKVYVSTGCKRDYTMRTVIYGTKGTVIADNTSPHISLYLESFEGVDKLYGHPMKHIAHQIPVKINSHNVLSEIEEFCQCIVDSSALRITAEEGAKTVAVCETIIKSSETGKPEKVVY
jgi:predicted dehydrogenase